jgi:hypothetical protein
MDINIPFLTPFINNLTDFFILLFVIIYLILFFVIQYYLVRLYIWLGTFLSEYFPIVKEFLTNHLGDNSPSSTSNKPVNQVKSVEDNSQ